MAEHDLPFPSDMDDWSVPQDVEQSLAGRLQASYAALPPSTPANLSRAVQTVLAAVERADRAAATFSPTDAGFASDHRTDHGSTDGGTTGERLIVRPAATRFETAR